MGATVSTESVVLVSATEITDKMGIMTVGSSFSFTVNGEPLENSRWTDKWASNLAGVKSFEASFSASYDKEDAGLNLLMSSDEIYLAYFPAGLDNVGMAGKFIQASKAFNVESKGLVTVEISLTGTGSVTDIV